VPVIATPQETFLGLEDAAAALQCSPETVAEYATSGELPGAKVGRAWVFTVTDLVAFLKTRQKGEEKPCASTSGARSGTRTSGSKASLALVELLGTSSSSRKSRRGSKRTGSPQPSNLRTA